MFAIMHVVQVLIIVATIIGPACLQRNHSLTLPPKIISQGDGLCPSNLERESAREDIHISVRALLQTLFRVQVPECGEGFWQRVTFLNMSDSTMQCPPSWREYTQDNVRACGRPVNNGGSCPSTVYDISDTQYSRVCGRIIGFQHATPGAFHVMNSQSTTLDDYYVDGISVTHGYNPRSHIWTFAAGASDNVMGTDTSACPCASTVAVPSPPFVGSNYFCESAAHGSHTLDFLPNDPLWDGEGCPRGDCCSFNSPPWFSVQLPSATMDNIEVRICADQDTNDEDIPIQLIELYVQ